MSTVIIRAMGNHPTRGSIYATGISVDEDRRGVLARVQRVRGDLWMQGCVRVSPATMCLASQSNEGFDFNYDRGGKWR